MKRLIAVLMLTGLAASEPRLFQAGKPVLGHVLLEAEDGEAEATAMARIGYNCALGHAHTMNELTADEAWAREQAGWEVRESREDWESERNDLTVIGLGKQSSLAWRRDGGVVCIDPAPDLSAYFDEIPGPFEIIGGLSIRCFWDPAFGRACESSLYTGMPLVLVDAALARPIELGRNCHTPSGSLSEDDSPLQKEVRRWLALHQPLPILGLPNARYRRSPNWDVRNLHAQVDTLAIYPSGTKTLEEAEWALLDDQDSRPSAHYVIGRDGALVQMIDERWTAWPDGAKGRSGADNNSLVVQLVNRGDGKETYSEEQYRAVASLLRNLRTRWEISDGHVFAKDRGAPVEFDLKRLLRATELQ